MRFLNLHGPLSSEYLYELTARKAGNRHNVREAIKDLYDGGMTYKPIQQRATDQPDGHFHVYDLTEKGRAYLKADGLWADAVRPTGNWVHQFMVATITATMHIMCERSGYRYIPPHEYLDGKKMTVDVPFAWNGNEQILPLAPDALFAIDYGGSFIAFALEADRNTEPNRPRSWMRKSDLRMLRQYACFIGKRLYNKAYGRKARLVLLYITVNEGHARNFIDLVADELGSLSYIAVGVATAFETPFYPPKLLSHLFNEGLRRARKGPFTMNSF